MDQRCRVLQTGTRAPPSGDMLTNTDQMPQVLGIRRIPNKGPEPLFPACLDLQPEAWPAFTMHWSQRTDSLKLVLPASMTQVLGTAAQT